MRLSSGVAIVTGGGRGIGRAVCERLSRDGWIVAAAARSKDELLETQSHVEQLGGKCVIHAVNVCTPGEIESVVERTEREFDRIDLLVNNAGAAPLASIEHLEPAIFNAIVSVNVEAVYRACRAVWTAMMRQVGGVIVNISSMASIDPFPGFTAYGAAKAWVNTWTKGLSNEGSRHGIRVYAIAPGAVETKMLRDAFPQFPAEQTLSPEEVSEVVHAMAQPECRYASGETVFLQK